MASGGQKDFWYRTQDKIWAGNKEVWLLLSFKSDIYFWMLRCFCVNFIWISDLEFHSFRESTKGYLGIQTTQWGQEYVGPPGLVLQYTFLLCWGTLDGEPWGSAMGSPGFWKQQDVSPDDSLSTWLECVKTVFSAFFQYIFPKDTGIWDKVTHWKGHSITRSFRDNLPRITRYH